MQVLCLFQIKVQLKISKVAQQTTFIGISLLIAIKVVGFYQALKTLSGLVKSGDWIKRCFESDTESVLKKSVNRQNN